MNQHLQNRVIRKLFLSFILSSLCIAAAYSQPTVNIGAPSLTDTNSGPVTYSVTYTGATTVNLTPGDITLDFTGDANGLVAVFNGTTNNPTVTISSITGDGTLGITIAAGTSEDGSMVPDVGAGPSTTFNVDNTPPTVSIGAPSTSDTQGGPVTFSITYSGASSVNLTSGDITLNKTGSADGSISVSNGTTNNPTVTISSITGDGTLGISIAGGTSSDAVGNSDTGAGPGTTFNVDNTPPTVSIGAPSSTDTNTGPVTFSIAYSGADNVNLTSGDITLNTSGTANGSVSVSNGTTSNPTVTISSITGNGTLGITIAAGTSSDNAGNTDSGDGPGTTFNVDNIPPTASIGTPSLTDTNTGPVTFSITYSGADIVSLTSGNITLNKTGSADGSVSVSNGTTNNPTVTISSITGDGTLGISISSASSDNAGNTDTGDGPSTTFNVDNTPPSVSIGAPSVTDTQAGPVTFSITYTGSSSVNLTSGDITLNKTGSANGSVSVSNGTTNNPTVTISSITGDGTLGITIAAGTSSDPIGNLDIGAGPSTTFNVDNTPPSVSIGAPSSTDTNSGPITFSITYSGASTVNLTSGDITLNKTGSADGSVSVSNGTTNNPTVTISSITGNGTLGITIAAATSSDLVGNSDTGAGPSTTFNVDNLPPTASIGAPSSALTNSGPVTYSITYSGADNVNLTSGNITLNKTGTADGSVSVSNGATSNPTVTISSITGNGTLGISISSASSDNAGNTDTGAGPSTTFNVDNNPPSFSAVTATPNFGTAKVTDVVTVTLTSVGAETTLSAGSTITVNGVNRSGTFMHTGGGVYTVTYTVIEGNTDRAAGALPIHIEVDDPAGNTATVVAFTDGNSLAIDAHTPSPPSTPDLAAADDTGSSMTDNITKNTTGLTISGTAETNSSVELFVGAASQGTTTATGGNWTFDISLANGGPYAITAKATDAAGNISNASGTLNVTVDNVPPSQPGPPNLKSSDDSFSPYANVGTNNDNITNVNMPGFIDTSTKPEANSIVKIYSHLQGVVGTGSADGSGDFDFNLSTTLSDNTHTLTITATDVAGNESSPSTGLNVTIDTQPPGVIPGGVQFYAHGASHDHIDIEFDETIDLANDYVLEPTSFTSSNGTFTGDSKYLTSYTTPTSNGSISKTNLAHLRGNNWTSATTISYISSAGEIYDIAGNSWPDQNNLPSTDPSPPTVVSGLIFNPDGPSGKEQITFRMSEELSLGEGASTSGFSVNAGSPGTQVYSDKGGSNTITLTSMNDGDWTQDALVSYTPGNVQDASANPLASFSNEPILLKNVIISSNNASPNAWAKEGDKVFLNFTTTSTLATAPIVEIDGTSASVSAGSLAPNYIYEITTTSGTTEGALSFSIITEESDDADSTNVTITTPGSQIVYDRTNPTITPISIASDYGAHPDHASPGYKAMLTFTVGDNLATPIVSAGNINIAGQAVTLSGSDPNYTAQTTAVLPSSIPEGNLSLSIQVFDGAGNSTTATAITTGSNVTFDKTPPTLSSIVVDPGSTFTGIGSTNGILATNTMNFIVTFNEPVDGVAATDFNVKLNPNTIPGATINNSGLTLTGGVDGDTQYTLRLDGVTGTGQIRLDYDANSASIFDLAGQITNNAPQVGGFFTVVSKQPSAQVTGIGTQNVTQSQIELTWTEGTPTDPPTHYLLVAHGPSGSFPSITDGDNSLIDTDDTDFSGDDLVVISVPAGTSSYVFSEGGTVTGLQAGSRYDFEIYSYTLAPGATNDNVDFNTSAAPTTFDTMPTAALTTITNGSGPATISSLNTSTANWTPVFTFEINDDENFTTNNNPPYDNVPTKFSQIIINQLNPATGTNTIAKWDQVIAAARLIDDEGNIQESDVTINETNITISNIVSEATTDLGWVDDNETKQYTLEIYLKSDMSGTENYPDNIDNLNFHFEVNQGSFTFDNTPGSGSTFKGAQSQNSGNGNNVIEVLPTQLVFSTQPDPNVGVNGVFPTTPIVTARDMNGNLDNDFNSSVTVTSTNGAINVLNAPTAFPTGPTTGVLTFPANFGLDAAGITKVQVASASPALVVQSNNVTVSYSDGSELSFNSGNTTISSLADTEPEKVDVFSFHLEDDVNPSIVNDGIGTLINQLVITQGTNNDVANWTHAIAGAKLFDGSTEITGTVNSTDITFSSIPNGSGQFGEIVDDGSKDFTLRIWLKSTIDPSISGSIDGDNLVFKIDESGVGLIANSSDLTNTPATSAETADTDNEIEVIATKLVFTTQPPAEVLVNANLSTSPVLEAFDANNNRDWDYNSPITVTNAKTLGMSNAPTTISSGLLNFAANFQYTDIGDGSAGNGTLTVTVSALAANGMVPASTISTDVFVRVGASTLITAGATSEPATFSSVNDTNPGSFVFDFTVTDDAGTEDDGNPTLISDLVITQGTSFNNAALSDWTQVIEGAILYDDEAGPNSLTGVVGTNSITFSAMPTGSGQLGYIGDDAAKVYELHIWLKDSIDLRISGFAFPMASYLEPTVTVDNKKLEFEVDEINISTVPTGSSFKSGETLASGNANQIDVSATAIDFTIEPPVSSSVNTPYSVRTEARDANDNRDVDFTNNLDNNVTNQGGLAMLNAPTTADNFTAGVFDFAPNFQYDESGASPAGKLTLQANGLVATSKDIEVIASFDSYVTADNTGLSNSINPIGFDAADIVNDGSQDIEIAHFILHDGKAPAIGMEDVDGATTNLTDLDIAITGFANLKRIALYAEDIDGNGDGLGTYSEIDEQSAAATINFEDISTGLFHAVDNKVREFIIVASFHDTYVDNDPIQITITNIEARLGGSQFDVGEPLPFTDPAKNFVDVSADQLDFFDTPLNAIQGVGIPITPAQPQVFANDAKGNLDVDFVETVTVTTPEAGLGTLPTQFSGGILNFPGFTYTSPGDGTLTVTSSSSKTTSSSDVIGASDIDVIHTTFANLDLGGAVNDQNNGIETQATLPAGGVNKAIIGFKVSSIQNTTNEPLLTSLTVRFGNPIAESLANIALVYSSSSKYTSPGTFVPSTTTIGSDYVTFSGLNIPLDENEKYYFVRVDILATANFSTPSITPVLIANSSPYPFLPDEDVVLSSGSVDANITGRTYGFKDNNPPVIEMLVPDNGDENFPQSNLISMTFNEVVTPLDSIITVYKLIDNTPVSTLKLDGLLTSPDKRTFYFNPDNPLTGSTLEGDTYYYILVPEGDIATQKGFIDESNNEFAGITSSDDWYFKTSDNVPPIFPDGIEGAPSNPNVVNILDVGFDLRVALDEKGKVYYIVVDPNVDSGTPTAMEVREGSSSLTYTGTILAEGTADILQDSVFHYISVFDGTGTNFPTPGARDFRVWVTAEDIALPSPNQMATAVNVDGNFTSNPGGGIIIQNTPLNDPVDVCIGEYQTVFAPINIVEGSSGDFNAGSGQTINFILPPNFEYKTDNVTVTGQGGDISNVSFGFINNTILRITYDISGTGSRDKLIIAGMEIKALGSEGTTGDIIRLGGTGAATAIPDGTVLVHLNTTQIAPVEFNTIPATSAIGNINEEVPLEAEGLSPIDKGTAVYSGPGVFGDILYTAVSGLGTHTITLNYTNENGCTSTYSIIRTIFDSNKAIAGLDPTYCTNDAVITIPSNGLENYDLIGLGVEIADNQPAEIANPSDPFLIDVNNSLDTLLNGDYNFYPTTFSFQENFDKFTNTVAGTNEGGLVGELLFTGVYQSIFDDQVRDTLEQRVQIYFSPTAEISIGDYLDIGDNTFDAANILPTTTAPIELEFCEDEGDIPLQGSSPNGHFAISIPHLFANDSTGFPGLLDNGDGTGSLNPQTMVDNSDFSFGEAIVKFIVDAPGGGCSNEVAQTIRIHPKPKADFTVPAVVCEDTPISFTDATGYLPADSVLVNNTLNNAVFPSITNWTWVFDDPKAGAGNLNTATGESEPSHMYEDPGLPDVSLTIENEFGCTDQVIIQQTIGGIPRANFDFGGTSKEEPIVFQSTSDVDLSSPSSIQSIDRVLWDIDGDGNFDIDDDDMDPANNNETVFTRNYTNAGIYDVQFVAIATTGCSDTLMNQIAILRNETISVDNTYSDSFESDDGGWLSLPEVNGSDNSWSHGTPAKTSITPTSEQGSNIWITGLSNPYESGERSYLYSPAINFSALERPMVQFDMYRQLDSQDGVILEYSIDSLNIMDPNKVWISLGDDIGLGVDWYNAIGLAGNPGKNNVTGLGWDGNSDGWLKAKYDLEETYISGATPAEKDKIKSRIILRFGLGAIASDKSGSDGFGFDNFRLGNRTRTVLLENFASSQDDRALTNSEGNAFQNNAIETFQSDHPSLAVIQYHTNLDGTDPLSNSPAGDARALYYGIGTTPRVALDGVADPDRVFTEWAEDQYGQQALNIAGADIQTVLQSNGSNIDIISTVTARQDIPANWVLHTIIVDNVINVSELPNNSNIETGETEFYNVVRKMIPSPAGKKEADPLTDGESRVISQEWSPSMAFDPGDYTIIVFMQNETSKEIYQATVITPAISTVTGIDDELEKRSIAVYPNPSNTYFTLQLGKEVEDDTRVRIFNQLGQVMHTTQIQRGSDHVQINSAQWNPGIYYVQTELDGEPIRERVVIQHK